MFNVKITVNGYPLADRKAEKQEDLLEVLQQLQFQIAYNNELMAELSRPKALK